MSPFVLDPGAAPSCVSSLVPRALPPADPLLLSTQEPWSPGSGGWVGGALRCVLEGCDGESVLCVIVPTLTPTYQLLFCFVLEKSPYQGSPLQGAIPCDILRSILHTALNALEQFRSQVTLICGSCQVNHSEYWVWKQYSPLRYWETLNASPSLIGFENLRSLLKLIH